MHILHISCEMSVSGHLLIHSSFMAYLTKGNLMLKADKMGEGESHMSGSQLLDNTGLQLKWETTGLNFQTWFPVAVCTLDVGKQRIIWSTTISISFNTSHI